MAVSKIKTIDTQILQPIAGSNITIIKGGYTRIGKIVMVNIQLKTTANISQNNVLLSNFPKSLVNPYFIIGNGYNSNAYGCRIGLDKLYSNTAIPSDTELNIQGVYYAHD